MLSIGTKVKIKKDRDRYYLHHMIEENTGTIIDIKEKGPYQYRVQYDKNYVTTGTPIKQWMSENELIECGK